MIILGFIISIVLFVLATLCYKKWSLPVLGFGLGVFGVIILLTFLILCMWCAVCMAEASVAEDKIQMYSEINETLKTQIEQADSGVPVLELVSTYNKNLTTITFLREQQLNLPLYRWWLYFGS